ncbi:hypothetical protein OCU04_012585 [Sclerotinia nivalis]|uniref:Uncharacterized protein n=1 Tax=Sclerotinia nivalis TaxID=352851 RepID=A0A9X0DDE5_9HELO|nr:hypothetical protein OCU04_012585 [Sclerotinia nivalis]
MDFSKSDESSIFATGLKIPNGLDIENGWKEYQASVVFTYPTKDVQYQNQNHRFRRANHSVHQTDEEAHHQSIHEFAVQKPPTRNPRMLLHPQLQSTHTHHLLPPKKAVSSFHKHFDTREYQPRYADNPTKVDPWKNRFQARDKIPVSRNDSRNWCQASHFPELETGPRMRGLLYLQMVPDRT